ncbi:Cytochrome b6-f complex subunit 7, partial [Mucuna pruriens]
MAMATAVVCPHNIAGAIVSSTSSKTKKRMNKIVHIRGLNSFGGLKPSNDVVSLGLPLSTEKCFAKIVSSVKGTTSNGKGKGGGALSSTCNAAGEIFTIATIINGLVLVGVAVGFVLLRVEAWVEESEAE